MAEDQRNPVIRHIRYLIGSVPTAAMSDGQLLERFLASRDETALEGLIRRYGPLVSGVCRRVLHNAHAAEDTFQATFLVLVRKAPALDRAKPLGNWLYTVAYRLALRARANEARRRQGEAQAARNRADTPRHPTTPGNLVALEEELQKLPAKHRAPLVLCYLEGKTNEQAADVLGCPRGSMSARLTQARERLRACLARRGYGVPSAGIAALLTPFAAEAAVPLPLLSNTVRAALWFAGEPAGTAGFVSTQAVALARSTCRAMFLNKLKIAAAVLLVTAMLGTGATFLLKAASQTRPPAQAVELPAPKTSAGRVEPFPTGAIARMGTTQLRHGDAVYFAAYTPEGKNLVTAGRDRSLRLWDLATGKEIRRFSWAGGQPDREAPSTQEGAYQKNQQLMRDDIALSNQAALSADGKMVAASRGGVVCLWETASGKKLRQLQTGQEWLVQLAFSADGTSLLTLGAQALRQLDGSQAIAVWDVATGNCIRRSQGKRLPGFKGTGFVNIEEQTAIVSPGLKYLAFQRRDDTGILRIHISDLATGKELAQIERGGFGGMHALCFSADDKTLLWDHYPADDIVFSDVTTGKELRRLGDHRSADGAGRSDATIAIALSANGKMLAICRMSHTIECWDLVSGKHTYPVGRPTGAQLEQWFTDWVGANVRPALAFSADGKKLVCSQGGATLRQFQVDTGQEIPGSGSSHRAPVSTLALSAEGKSLWTYGSGDAGHVWNWATGKQTQQPGVPARATYAAFTAGGAFAYAVGNQVTLCGPAKGSDPRSSNGPTSLPDGVRGKQTWKIAAGEFPPLAALALSPDGALVATRSFDSGQVLLWDANGQPRFTLGQTGRTFNTLGLREAAGVVTPEAVFSPDGRRLAAAGPRRQLCLWDVARGTLLWELPPQAGQAIERFAFSPSGHFLACVQADGTLTLHEAVSGATCGRLGEADFKQRRVYLAYDNHGKSRLAQATRRAAPVCLAFSADGRYLAVAQHRAAIHLWDVLAAREVGQLKGHEGGVVSLLFTPDGKHLLSGGNDTTVLTWNVARLTRQPRTHAVRLAPRAIEGLWTDLAGQDAARAFAALCKLCFSPDQAVMLIQERVCPARSLDPKQLAQDLADLQSELFERRQQAASNLERLGGLAEPALRQALADDPPLDLRQRLERLLKQSGKAPPAKLLRDLRAVEALELIGSPAARQVLRALANGAPGARLTRQAQRAGLRAANQTARP